jgi:hypothetical protein
MLSYTSKFPLNYFDFRWHEEEEVNSIYYEFNKTANTFRIRYQPWYEVWRLLMKPWDKKKRMEKNIDRIFEIETDNLSIDIRTLVL